MSHRLKWPLFALTLLLSAEAVWASPPSFDCKRANGLLSKTICRDEKASVADWQLVSAYWALAHQLKGLESARFKTEHLRWLRSIDDLCALGGQQSDHEARQASCVAQTYLTRVADYRRRLQGDALEEARSSPEQHRRIQAALNALGLQNQGEGKFGPPTRDAIRGYQSSIGHPATGVLTHPEVQSLLYPRRRDGSGHDLQFDETREALEQVFGLRPGPHLRQPYSRPTSPYYEQAPEPAPNGRKRDTANGEDNLKFRRFGEEGASTFEPPKSTQTDDTHQMGLRIIAVVGTGSSVEEARNEASRLAVQKVAGLYVDARRKVETQVSDQKIKEVVEEKIISYTNAYIAKFDITDIRNKDGLYEVQANVSVALAPLLKVLQENSVPVIQVDVNTNTATAASIAAEKKGAMDIYADLIARSAGVVTVGVGKAEIDPSIPSGENEAWLSIPITFKVNEDALREWKTKFEIFSRKRQEIDIPIRSQALHGDEGSAQCSIPYLDVRFAGQGQSNLFLTERTFNGDRGIAACFTTSSNPKSAHLECLGRNIFIPEKEQRDFYPCPDVHKCFLLKGKTRRIGLILRMEDKQGSEVLTAKITFRDFPEIYLLSSQIRPSNGENSFLNYCIPGQSTFFKTALREDGFPFGDVLIFPEPGSRLRAFYNQLVPNEKIARIATIKAEMMQDLSSGARE